MVADGSKDSPGGADDDEFENDHEPVDFVDFVRQHGRQLLHHACRIADNRGQGEDAFQEALVSAHTAWLEVARMDNPFGWMSKVIRYKVYHLRQAHVERPMASLPVNLTSMVDPAETIVDNTPIWDALRQLPAAQRLAVSLTYTFGMSVAEIAAQQNVAESTVRSNLSRARARMRVLLERSQGDDSS